MLVALGILSLLPGSMLQGYTPLVRSGILLLLPVIITQATITTANAYFQNVLKYDLAAKAQNIGSIVTAAAVIICMITTSLTGPYIGVIALLLGSASTAYVALSYIRTLHGNIFPQFQFRAMVADVKKTLPLGLTLVLNLIYFHSDSVILTLTRSTKEVGIYGLAYKVFELSLVFPIYFINSMYPALLRVQKSDTRSSTQLFWRSTQLLLASSFVIGACLWALAPLLVFVRPDFYQSILPLRILLFGLPIFFLSALFMWMLIVQKQQWKLLIIHGCVMVLNIILNLFFIPRYGYVSAAWITGISETITCVISFVFVKKKL